MPVAPEPARMRTWDLFRHSRDIPLGKERMTLDGEEGFFASQLFGFGSSSCQPQSICIPKNGSGPGRVGVLVADKLGSARGLSSCKKGQQSQFFIDRVAFMNERPTLSCAQNQTVVLNSGQGSLRIF